MLMELSWKAFRGRDEEGRSIEESFKSGDVSRDELFEQKNQLEFSNNR